MAKHYNLLVLGVVVVGLALGAFIASTRPNLTESAQASSRQGGNSAYSQAQGGAGGQAQGGAGGQAQAQGRQSGGGQGGQGGAAGGARPLSGSIASVDSGVMTVTTQQGDAKVKIGDAKIEKTVEGAASDIQKGDRVAVDGQQGSDGVFAANSIRILTSGDTGGQEMVGGQRPSRIVGQGQSPQQSQSSGQGQSTGQAGSGARGMVAMGTVSSVDGDTLTVSTQQGEVKVKVTGARVQKTVEGTTADLKAGERVTVTGQEGSDGTFTASSIQIAVVGEGADQQGPQPSAAGR